VHNAVMQRPLPREAFGDPATYAGTRLPVDLASTLIPDAYTSDEYHALEQQQLFGTSWVGVAMTSELAGPGDFLLTEVAGRSLIVCRNRAGELRAFDNVCRHRGAQLCAARGHVDRFFQCPYHAWAYDLDGKLLGTPLFTPDSQVPVEQRAAFDMSDVKAFDKADFGLHEVRVAAFGPVVLVCLDPAARELDELLGDLGTRLAGYRMDEWEVARRTDYEIDANWKLVAENFMEYYHLPWVHPGLVKVSPINAHYRWQGPGRYIGFCTSPIASNSDDGGWQGLPAIEGLSDVDAVSARFVVLFPNVAISVLPNHAFIMLMQPKGPGHTSEATYLLTNPESRGLEGSEDAIDELLRFWDAVNLEDVEIVETVQRGLANTSYTGGRMCYRFEESVHRFQNLVIDRLLGIDRIPPGDAVEQAPMFVRDGV
jgi:phenylpropionate dioxygenase-like ring-hydroxylating dioxygenase large terminal subunit